MFILHFPFCHSVGICLNCDLFEYRDLYDGFAENINVPSFTPSLPILPHLS